MPVGLILDLCGINCEETAKNEKNFSVSQIPHLPPPVLKNLVDSSVELVAIAKCCRTRSCPCQEDQYLRVDIAFYLATLSYS